MFCFYNIIQLDVDCEGNKISFAGLRVYALFQTCEHLLVTVHDLFQTCEHLLYSGKIPPHYKQAPAAELASLKQSSQVLIMLRDFAEY